MLNFDDLTAFAQSLVQTRSFTGEEGPLAQRVEGRSRGENASREALEAVAEQAAARIGAYVAQ